MLRIVTTRKIFNLSSVWRNKVSIQALIFIWVWFHWEAYPFFSPQLSLRVFIHSQTLLIRKMLLKQKDGAALPPPLFRNFSWIFDNYVSEFQMNWQSKKILPFVTIILLDLTFLHLTLPSTNSFLPFAPGVFNTNINNNVARNETALH